MKIIFWQLPLFALVCTSLAAAKPTRAPMDYGPFLSSSVVGNAAAAKNTILAAKAITIRVGASAYICFDTDLVRFAGAWSAGPLDLSHNHMMNIKGDQPAIAPGQVALGLPQVPGWSEADAFEDPRPDHLGPAPKAITHYRGLYRHGEDVILSYTVGKAKILELPASVSSSKQTLFTRAFHITPGDRPLSLLLATGQNTRVEGNIAYLEGPGSLAAAALVDAPAGTRIEITPTGQAIARFPQLHESTTIRVALWSGAADQHTVFASLLKMLPPLPDIPSLCHGGPNRWGNPLTLRSALGPSNLAYTFDPIPVPESNPFNAWMRLSGLDFFSDGRAAVCTFSGDVWIVSGLDDKLDQVSWQRFATGLYEPLGLRIVDDQVYVLGRDQITRLHDLNSDGEADFYENFNNDAVADPVYHAFAMDLQTDSEGNFYYTRCAVHVPPNFRNHGVMARISKDGSRYESFAYGFRVPNGMAISPTGQIVCSDNQGNWVPVCKINRVERDKYYGFPGDPAMVSKTHPYTPELTRSFTPPIVWIPMDLDNSSGGEVFCTSDRWGPMNGHMLHLSYGKASLLEVMTEEINGVDQGWVCRFPLNFSSGIMRGRFSPKDGQLYVCGLIGWQTAGSRDGALARVRYTGRPLHMPTAVRTASNGLRLTFSAHLDPPTATDPDRYSAQIWNYVWSATYGSKDYSVAHPGKIGRDTLDIKSATLSPDHQSIFLAIPDLRPAMQVQLRYNIKSADGIKLDSEIDGTIHILGPPDK